MLDQVNQEIEHLGLDRDEAHVTAQLAAFRVERNILEQISHAGIPHVAAVRLRRQQRPRKGKMEGIESAN